MNTEEIEKTQNTKSYKFNDLSDYIFYLSELILELIQGKEQIEIYILEVESAIDKNPNAQYIDSLFYDSMSDKIMRTLQTILNLIGDDTKKAVSYRRFRKKLFQQKDILSISIEKLSIEEDTILNRFNELRNWGLHFPESLFIKKRTTFNMDKNFVIENKNKIIIPKYQNYDIKFLHNIKNEIQAILNAVEMILILMKNDYKSLIKGEFEIEYEVNFSKPFFLMDIVQDSWNDQIEK